jgi:hypothetical protein
MSWLELVCCFAQEGNWKSTILCDSNGNGYDEETPIVPGLYLRTFQHFAASFQGLLVKNTNVSVFEIHPV